MNHYTFAKSINQIPESFIREILKVSINPGVISFAGGLPHPSLFPAAQIADAADKVLRTDGHKVLQYATSEGYLPLRDYIAELQSKKEGCYITAEEVLVLNGSQQGLDLAGKLFINPGDPLLMEGPTYLGAIQAFSAYQPDICEVRIKESSMNNDLTKQLELFRPKLFYFVPNFQNPTGNTYSMELRTQLAEKILHSDCLLLEDNPYGELWFERNDLPTLRQLAPQRTLYLGSFSKIISPGMRLGWAIGPEKIIRKMTVAKQASDLHTSYLSQRIMYQYLLDNPLEDHLHKIRQFYKLQFEYMLHLIETFFPADVIIHLPKGGMFLWVELPLSIDTCQLLLKAIESNILFVPGHHFYTSKTPPKNAMRLNFSHPTFKEMEFGIRILGNFIKWELLKA